MRRRLGKSLRHSGKRRADRPHTTIVFDGDKMNKYICKKVNGKRIDEHRLIAIAHWGAEACKGNDVHHINGNKADNRIENLELKPRSEHSREHRIGQKASLSTRKKLSKSLRQLYKGQIHKRSKIVEQEIIGTGEKRYYESATATGFFGYDSGTVRATIAGFRKRYRGSLWRYVGSVPDGIKILSRLQTNK